MTKNTQSQLDTLIEKIGRVKAYADNLSAIQSPDKVIFWKALKDVIDKAKQAHTDRIMSVLAEKDIMDPQTSYLEVKFLRGCIAAYEEILGVVDENDDACAEASAKIKELKQKAEDIKNNIDLQ